MKNDEIYSYFLQSIDLCSRSKCLLIENIPRHFPHLALRLDLVTLNSFSLETISDKIPENILQIGCEMVEPEEPELRRDYLPSPLSITYAVAFKDSIKPTLAKAVKAQL